jgi:hypothetical protein
MFTGMRAAAMSRKPRPDTCHKVFDSGGRRGHGLWQRNKRFFAILTVSNDLGRKTTCLVPPNATTLDEAKADYARLHTERADDRLRPLGMVPTFADYVEIHTQHLVVSGKRASSVEKEIACLKQWTMKVGNLRLNKIRPYQLINILTELANEGYSARSLNLHLIAMRGRFKAALCDGHIKPPHPFERLGWQRVDQKSRRLCSPDEVDRLCEFAGATSKNGRQFTDDLPFPAILWGTPPRGVARALAGCELRARPRHHRCGRHTPRIARRVTQISIPNSERTCKKCPPFASLIHNSFSPVPPSASIRTVSALLLVRTRPVATAASLSKWRTGRNFARPSCNNFASTTDPSSAVVVRLRRQFGQKPGEKSKHRLYDPSALKNSATS